MKKRKIKRNNLFIYIGLFLVMISSFMLIYKHCRNENLDKKEEIKIEQFFEEEIDTSISETPTTPVVEKKKTNISYNYVAVLEIPKINLKRGLVEPTSKYNNVNYNIQVIESSTMPDQVNGNLILAGHNGASYISFFKNLYKLNINDKVYIYYNGIKYEYVLNRIYETSKDGNIEIYRDQNKTTITLITCKKNSKDKQMVYIGYLNNEETY